MSTTTTIPSATTGASKKVTISKILVAIDGSDESMDAADYAISISKKYNAELYALHVIRADVDLFGPHETSEFMTRMRNEGEKYLNKVKLNANEINIQIKTEIISSINIAGGIVDYAEENNIDLIVIGTRGRSGFKKLLLGSVASHVVMYAHCPVMAVK
ncbi:MAG: universal stress protein [Candidatus Nitrosopolaris sp.]